MDGGRDRFDGGERGGGDSSGEDDFFAGKYILTPADVASIFGVSAKTVSRWAQSGRLPGFHTPGGHYRFKRSDVEALYNEHSRSRRSEKSREGM